MIESKSTTQSAIDALADDAAWCGGWYQPIIFPDGSRTHSSKLDDAAFYGSESRGMRKWESVIAPSLPPLEGKRFLEIGCNAGLYLVAAKQAGAAKVYGVESHPQFFAQARFVLSRLCPEAELIHGNALTVELPTADVTLLANALYWMVYSDERGLLPDHEQRMKQFLRRLTGTVVIVGTEEPVRYSPLSEVLPLLDGWDVKVAKVVPVNDRTLNLVVACHQ